LVAVTSGWGVGLAFHTKARAAASWLTGQDRLKAGLITLSLSMNFICRAIQVLVQQGIS